MKTKHTSRKTKLSKQQELHKQKVEEGRQLLENVQVLIENSQWRALNYWRRGDGCYLETYHNRFMVKKQYSIPDLAVFADQHQRALDFNPKLNGTSAVFHVLDLYYRYVPKERK